MKVESGKCSGLACFATTIIFLFLIYNCSLAKINIDSEEVLLLERGRVTEFIGDVRITASNFTVTAQRAVSKKQEGIIKVDGNVYIKYSSSTFNTEGWCSELEIIIGEENYIMTGDVKTIYITDDNDMTEIYTDKVTFDYSLNQKALFEGNVKAKRKDLTVSSGKALYLRKDRRIEFTDLPEAVSTTQDVRTEYAGDSIVLFMDDEKVKISGSAHIVVHLN